MHQPLRVAFFTCAYNEIDGVATTSRQFEAFARRNALPLLSIHGGSSQYFGQEYGSVVRYQFQRRWPRFALDANHDYDLYFWRYYAQIENVVRTFRPDVIHITGPSDVGQAGALAAHRLSIPLAASWHTNVHEYAERRLQGLLSVFPFVLRNAIAEQARSLVWRATACFYRMARMLFAPNPDLVRLLQQRTRKPVHLMARGVDTELFHPDLCAADASGEFTIGYVGRLAPEKNVRFLESLERGIEARGFSRFRLLIVGQGSQEAWLRARLRRAVFTGVLHGEALASAYRQMHVLAFPSRTDTYGNVIQEAAASGVPSVVTSSGGPKFIVAHGETGFVAADDREFIESVALLMAGRNLLERMGAAARRRAMCASWDTVFRLVYAVYRQTLTDGSSAAVDQPKFDGAVRSAAALIPQQSAGAM